VKETEFGRGYATCLFQFVAHEQRLDEDIRIYSDESNAVEMWANGASDHLYDLITGPRVKKFNRQLAKSLASLALECGHGFTSRKWTSGQARAWVAIAKSLLADVGDPQTIENAMAVDKRLGLRPELGITCLYTRKGI
jgi:hypothetical protein